VGEPAARNGARGFRVSHRSVQAGDVGELRLTRLPTILSRREHRHERED
jgi:hypothetical protein